MSETARNHYDTVAGCYDALAALYSLGRIAACKRSQMGAIEAGDRVLFAGAGSGAEAVLAARRAAAVTVVELSPRMLARAGARFQAEGVAGAIEAIPGDVLEHRREGGYDVVVAHFFLNVFGEDTMDRVLAHLARQLRPGGRLLIADFAPAQGGLAARLSRGLYFGLAVLAFRLMAGNALHGTYDYAPRLPAAGLRLDGTRDFRVLGVGPALFRTLTASRP